MVKKLLRDTLVNPYLYLLNVLFGDIFVTHPWSVTYVHISDCSLRFSSKRFNKLHDFYEQRIKKWFGIILAAMSGLIMTLYSAIYKTIKTDIDNSTVLMIRAGIQVCRNFSNILWTAFAPILFYQKMTKPNCRPDFQGYNAFEITVIEVLVFDLTGHSQTWTKMSFQFEFRYRLWSSSWQLKEKFYHQETWTRRANHNELLHG